MKFTTHIITLALGLGVGIFLAQTQSQPDSTSVSDQASEKERISARSTSGNSSNSLLSYTRFTRKDQQILSDFSRRLQETNTDDYKALFEELGRNANELSTTALEEAYDQLFFIWMQADPKAAMAIALNDSYRHYDHLLKAAGRIAEETPQKAIADIEAFAPSARAKSWLIQQTIISISATDIELALKLVEERPGYALGEVLENLANKDPQRALAMAEKHARYGDSRLIASTYESWFKKEPQAALEASLALSGTLRREVMRSLINQWSMKDPWAAAEWAAKEKILTHRSWAGNSLVERLAEKDPAKALEWVRSNFPSAKATQASQSALRTWMNRDPEQALAWLQKQPNPGSLGHGIVGPISELARETPDEALRLLEKIQHPTIRDEALARISRELSRRDPERALKLAAEIKNADHRSSQISSALAALANAEPEAALSKALAFSKSAEKEAAVRAVLGTMVNLDPALAEKTLLQISDPSLKLAVTQSVVRQLAQESPKLGLNLADQLEGDVREKAISAVLGEWHSDPEGKTEYLLTAAPSPALEKHAWGTATEYAQANPEKALELTRTLEHNSVSKTFVQSTFTALAKKDPVGAAEALTSHDYNEHFSNVAYRSVAHTWVDQDRDSAIAWATSIEHPGGQNQAYAAISDSLTRKQPQKAREWIETLPEGNGRDFAVQSYVWKQMKIDPASTINWATTISDESRRWNLTRQTLSQWNGRDPEAAQQWMDNAGFTPDQVEDVKKGQ